MTFLLEAIGHHREGRLVEAAKLYRQALAENPENREALKLLAILLADAPEITAAQDLLQRYLALAPEDPAALHTLGRLRRRVDDHPAAIELFSRAIAKWPDHAPLYNDLGEILHRGGRLDEALAALQKAVALDPNWPLAHYNLATLYFDAGDLAQAEAAYRRVLALARDFYDAYPMLAETLELLHRPEEAERQGREFAKARGVVVNPCRTGTPEARVLLVGGTGKCNLNPDFIVDNARFTTIKLHLPPVKAGDAEIPPLPPFDIAFSIVADADRGVPYVPQVAAFCAGLSCPVLNFPDDRIERTRRDRLPDVLAGIPGVAMPRTRVVARTVLETSGMDVSGGAAFLIRPRGSHNGRDLVRIDDGAALKSFLGDVPFEDFYVTDYVDYSRADRHFRKYRFIFVDRKAYPYHLAISDHWLIHYHRTPMATTAWMRDEEEAFLADYESAFPGDLGAAVRTIGRTLDMDYAGLDCSVTPDGKVLVFEANAAMLAHCADPRDVFPYKHRYVPRIFDAVGRMINDRLR